MKKLDDSRDEKRLSAKLEALCPHCKRRRGRPPTGFAKALKYTDEVFELRRAGRSSWRAIVEIAAKNWKTPEHIAACVKRIKETDPHEYLLEPDRTEDLE